jgi:hypothetical protein
MIILVSHALNYAIDDVEYTQHLYDLVVEW